MNNQPNMKRWSDAKLDKELYFARAAKDDNHQENLDWLASIEAEAARRSAVGDRDTRATGTAGA